MNRTIIKLFFCLCIVTALPSYAYNTVHYYFRTVGYQKWSFTELCKQDFSGQERLYVVWY